MGIMLSRHLPETLYIHLCVPQPSTGEKEIVVYGSSVVLNHRHSFSIGQPVSSNMSEIQQFYVGKNIFITGGTGFLGVVLIEKLLRSCRDIGIIYILIRPKKGKSVEERLDALLGEKVFDPLRKEYPEFSQKIVGVEGDTAKNGFGLSSKDYLRLTDEVSVIFHLAASVRFTEKLESAVLTNVNSVKYAIDLARACKNFKAGIYVSTAFSHCVRKSINEELYPPPMSYQEVNTFVEMSRRMKWSEDVMESVTKTIIGEWPNTYSFTKAIAEGVVAEFAKDLPFAIFRPSIVTNSFKSPAPGWVSGTMGLAGLVYAYGLGLVHVALQDINKKADLVPVDYVCNALISSAWNTAIIEKGSSDDVLVYNYVSGNENPITWNKFNVVCAPYRKVYPSEQAVYHSFLLTTKSKFLFVILDFLLHLLPAIMIDLMAKLVGKQPKMYQLMSKIRKAWFALMYFATQEWCFGNQKIQQLWSQLGPEDKKIFPFSMRTLDWNEYLRNMCKGVRQFIAGESDDNLERAKRRYYCLYFIHVAVCLILGVLILWVIWRSFGGIAVTLATPSILSELL
ncbi:fatty acyl-CoA reductase 1-like [Diprion similis]|uniref:fatty acyl-CoA reductase 1-like n=1 Tax=Diprion similis TaxID=362088 RepID=UPI001EF84400|nr:fatty acyl-CoA reductase 1-like [Diprion similis]